jgi:hypothetical protein
MFATVSPSLTWVFLEAPNRQPSQLLLTPLLKSNQQETQARHKPGFRL